MAPSLFPRRLRERDVGNPFRSNCCRERGSGGGYGVEDDGFLAADRLQSRYGSVVLDKDHLMAAARYVALNPARARLVSRAQDWRWSSVRAHLDQRDDGLVNVAPLLDRCNGRFVDLIDSPAANEAISALRGAETIGRPLGSPPFLDRLATLTGRDPRPRKRGPKPAANRGFSKVSP
jgi:putative transposase